MSLPSTDPIATSWLIALTALFIYLVAAPLFRALLAAVLYAIGAATGRQHLRVTAARVMPRVGHLIGGIVLGTAAVAAPAIANADTPRDLTNINLDRDAGVSARPGAPKPADRTDHVDTTTPATTHHEPDSTPKTMPASQAPTRSSTAPYVVRTGDSLWSIAADHLVGETNAEVLEAWKAIWRDNRAVIGDDPALIYPGQQLQLGSLA